MKGRGIKWNEYFLTADWLNDNENVYLVHIRSEMGVSLYRSASNLVLRGFKFAVAMLLLPRLDFVVIEILRFFIIYKYEFWQPPILDFPETTNFSVALQNLYILFDHPFDAMSHRNEHFLIGQCDYILPLKFVVWRIMIDVTYEKCGPSSRFFRMRKNCFRAFPRSVFVYIWQCHRINVSCFCFMPLGVDILDLDKPWPGSDQICVSSSVALSRSIAKDVTIYVAKRQKEDMRNTLCLLEMSKDRQSSKMLWKRDRKKAREWNILEKEKCGREWSKRYRKW